MRNGSLRAARALVFAVALSTLVAIAFLSNREWQDQARSRAEGLVATQATQANVRLLGWVRDAETGQRGYLLTGRPEYLAPYREAVVAIRENLRELHTLLAGDTPQMKRLAQLSSLIDAKLSELQQTIDLRDAHGVAAALAVVESDHGKHLMDEIRLLSEEIEAASNRRLTELRTEIGQHASQARLVTLTGAALLVLVLVLGFWLNERYSTQLENLVSQLDGARELLSTTLYSISEGVVTTDAAGRIQMMNSAAERLTGFAEAETRGKPVEEIFQPDARSAAAGNPVRDALESGAARLPGPPLKLRPASGPERMIEAAAAPIRDRGGSLLGAVLVFRDVTDRLQTDERLRQSDKLESLGILAGGIAHDFNNLLVGIIGSASLLQEHLPSNSQAAELLAMLQSSADHAARLTAQMLAYSGRGAFVVRQTDLSREVEGIALLLTASMPKHVELRLDTARGLPLIEADSSQLQQLVLNLVVNGAEAVGTNPGKVELRTARRALPEHSLRDALGVEIPAGDYVLLEVSDTGHGMDDATRARIFDPFFTTKFTGRGLGLAAVLGIVKGHGGAIVVESTPGHGATFRVFFPPAHTLQDPHGQPVQVR